jgi:15-cis-phytoene synthase
MTAVEAQDAKMVLRQNGRSFHFASHVLGKRQAENAARLYALCRAIDDIADDATDSQQADARLHSLSQALARHDANDRIAASALHLHQDTGFELEVLLALIDGVRSDLKPVRFVDEAQLVDYAYAVAGTVGLMMCSVLGVKDARAAPFAIDLGIAMQLTNIARDIGTDARLGRRYIPSSWIGDVEPEALLAPEGKLAEDLRKATQRLLILADRYYASGQAGLGFLPLRARLAIFTAARVYHAIGGQIAKAGFRPWQKRAVVSIGKKLAIGMFAVGEFVSNPRLHRTDSEHDANLHALIQHRPFSHRLGKSNG